ncbi:hypothetical protein YC2023_097187 [Brassica napus]
MESTKDLECVAGRASTLGNQTLFLPNRNITDHMEVENQMIWGFIDFSPRPHNSLIVSIYSTTFRMAHRPLGYLDFSRNAYIVKSESIKDIDLILGWKYNSQIDFFLEEIIISWRVRSPYQIGMIVNESIYPSLDDSQSLSSFQYCLPQIIRGRISYASNQNNKDLCQKEEAFCESLIKQLHTTDACQEELKIKNKQTARNH